MSIKVVSTRDEEIEIASSLCTDSLLQNPENHCVPIPDVLPDPLDESSRALMVMPYLRPFDDPDFATVGEVLDFMYQIMY